MNSLSRKNKILLIGGIVIFALSIPLTIIQVQKQQVIRQHAAATKDVSLYFADNESCATPRTTFPPASLSSSTAFYLCLAAEANEEGISGFNIALSAKNLTFKSPKVSSNSQTKFGTQIETKNNASALILWGFVVDISSNVVDMPFPLLNFSVTALQNSGNVSIGETRIHSLTQDSPLIVAKSSLSFSTTVSPAIQPATNQTQCTNPPTNAPCTTRVTIDNEQYTVIFTEFDSGGSVKATTTSEGKASVTYSSNWTGYTAQQVLANACGNNDKIIQAVAIGAGAIGPCSSIPTNSSTSTVPAPVAVVPAQTAQSNAATQLNENLKWIALTVNYHCAAPGPGTVTPEWNINDEAKSGTAINFQIHRKVGNPQSNPQSTRIGQTKEYSFQDPNPIEPSTYYEYQITNETSSVVSGWKGIPTTGVGICGASGVSGSGGGSGQIPFKCADQSLTVGGPIVKYECVGMAGSGNTVAQCQSGWTVAYPPQPNGSNGCLASSATNPGQACCVQGAAVPATFTPTPINNILLALTLNAQDVPVISVKPTTPTTPTISVTPTPTPAISGDIIVDLTLYNLTTNRQVSGAPAKQLFKKTPIPGRQYATDVTLTDLQQDAYFIIARKDNMIAKAAFTVSSENQTISVPTATLVFGDINNDADINGLDYNIFKTCWKKSVESTPSCASSDFDSNGNIDQIDYNTWLRGRATWSKEGKSQIL